MHAKAKRLLRIETRMSRTGTIEEFLGFATIPELWQIVPAMWEELPDTLKESYPLIATTSGLLCLYAGTEASIRPMLALLLKRWELAEPARVGEVIDEVSRFLRCQRARAQRDA